MRRILLLLAVALVMAAMLVVSAMPAFAHQAGPCTASADPGHSEFAEHHIVPFAQTGELGAGGHIRGTHQGFSSCL